MLVLPDGITDQMWWEMCDFHMDIPTPLHEADLTRPFVYERKWGVFYVPMGMHLGAMSLLLAFQYGCKDGIEVSEKLGLRWTEGTADHWLEHTPGAAFRSSVGKTIQVANTKGMTIAERRFFGKVSCVFP